MAAIASAESLTPAERADMLRAIEKRKNDLLEKRKMLENLSKTEAKSPVNKPATLSGSVDTSSLVKDVVAAMSVAQKTASEKPEVHADVVSHVVFYSSKCLIRYHGDCLYRVRRLRQIKRRQQQTRALAMRLLQRSKNCNT